MGSISNPKTWAPYMDIKDCSQGFCSIYCPQWCYIVFPPPPPFEFPEDSSGPSFSPLVIAIIGILASAFLLVSYYAIISKYCGNWYASRRTGNQSPDPDIETEENFQDPSQNEPWNGAGNGLDQSLIKSITVFKYRKGDGQSEGGVCSVCLGEFQENESLRLLPKCSHAFHVTCIDTWLMSHSNCPLCRANIVFVPALPPPVTEAPTFIEPLPQRRRDCGDSGAESDIEMGAREEETIGENAAKSPMRELKEVGNSEISRSSRGEVRDHEDQHFRRSISLDCSSQGRLSVADILRIDQEEEFQIEGSHFESEVGNQLRQR